MKKPVELLRSASGIFLYVSQKPALRLQQIVSQSIPATSNLLHHTRSATIPIEATPRGAEALSLLAQSEAHRLHLDQKHLESKYSQIRPNYASISCEWLSVFHSITLSMEILRELGVSTGQEIQSHRTTSNESYYRIEDDPPNDGSANDFGSVSDQDVNSTNASQPFLIVYFFVQSALSMANACQNVASHFFLDHNNWFCSREFLQIAITLLRSASQRCSNPRLFGYHMYHTIVVGKLNTLLDLSSNFHQRIQTNSNSSSSSLPESSSSAPPQSSDIPELPQSLDLLLDSSFANQGNVTPHIYSLPGSFNYISLLNNTAASISATDFSSVSGSSTSDAAPRTPRNAPNPSP